MGCDIHGWVEAKVDDKWVAYKELQDRSRNYGRFGVLAGVRCNECRTVPQGLPSDISDTAKLHAKIWDDDGHSHSHMPLQDAAKVFLSTQELPSVYQTKYPCSAFFGVEEGRHVPKEFRLVFWFDS